MELYKEILAKVLAQSPMQITFPNLHIDANQVVELQCYLALCRIKDVLADDTLDDKECFSKIEEIVCIFESIGSNGGYRHDFG